MQKWLEWALENKDDTFDDFIFTDEYTVQMESQRRFCCRKEGKAPRPKPRYICFIIMFFVASFTLFCFFLCVCVFLLDPNIPYKVHVWAGISLRGRTGICIFTGTMDRFLYIDILRNTLLPFVKDAYPDHYRFMADNDPKHNSVAAREFLNDNDINWWRTPAESPDLNPIENLWHELKEFIRREVKPKCQKELVEGITFWETVDVRKCQKYIGHLRKVIPRVIELKGAATGY